MEALKPQEYAVSRRTSVKPSLKKGQLISVKAILYLLLSVLSVILAVVLIVKLYAAFLGGSASKQDAELLASVINDMINREESYLQTVLLLRTDSQTILGFDQGMSEIRIINGATKFSVGVQLTATAINDPTFGTKVIGTTGCSGKSCICTSKDDTTGKCFNLISKKSSSGGADKLLELSSYYYPFKAGLPAKGGADSFFQSYPYHDIINGIYYGPMVIDSERIEVLAIASTPYDQAGTTIRETRVNTNMKILPLIVEKLETDDRIFITIGADSDGFRARQFYLQRCPKDSEDNCEGKTGFESIATTTNNGVTKQQYCGIIATSSMCEMIDLETCPANQRVLAPCLCGGEVIVSGICRGGNPYYFECSLVSKCEDYCLQDGSKDCSGTEYNYYCVTDMCATAPPGFKCEPGTKREATTFWRSTEYCKLAPE